MKSIGYHSKEKERDEYLDGARLEGANLAGAQLQGAHLATSWTGKSAPVRGLTVAQLAEADLNEATELPDNLRKALTDHHKRQQLADSATPTPPSEPDH
jgi:uncharacterized protein YjbI with pentapeptide repeats